MPSTSAQSYAHAQWTLSKSTQTLQSARAELLRYMHTSAAGPQPTEAVASTYAEAADPAGSVLPIT